MVRSRALSTGSDTLQLLGCACWDHKLLDSGWTWMDLDGSFLLITGWPVIATACSTNCCRGFCPWIHDAGRPLSFCIRMGQRFPKVTFYCPRHVQHETLRIVRGAAATSPAPGTKCRADACCGVRSWLSPQSFRGSHMCR
jgi:hypothetical protein